MYVGIVLFLYIIIGAVSVHALPTQNASFAHQNPAPQSYTCVVTSKPCGSSCIKRAEKSLGEEKFTRYSKKSMALLAALIPALKSAL